MLEFNVKGQTLSRTDKFKPATDSEQYLKAKFTFEDESWTGKAKTALFRVGSTSYEALLDSANICTVPSEALVYVGHMRNRNMGCAVYVSLVGEYSTTKITTNEIEIRLNASGCGETVTPETPTEDVYQQLLTAYADTQADVAEAKSAVETAVSECNAAEAAFTDAQKTFGGLFANAIIGNMSGSVVTADDVSPVEHELYVKAHGKNYVDTSKITVQPSTDNIYISAVGEGYIEVTTKESYDGNGHCVTWIKLKEMCPQMRAGKQYALSATTTAWNKMIYLKEMDMFWSYGTRQVVTEEMLECTIGFYGLNVIREQGTGTCRISNIQIEEGYEITDYTPYIDPSTVTVRRCGKNLSEVNSISTSSIITGTISEEIRENTTYTVSANVTKYSDDTALNTRMTLLFYYTDGTSDSVHGEIDSTNSERDGIARKKVVTGTPDQTKELSRIDVNVLGYSYTGTRNAKAENIQLEFGSEATSYEKYIGSEYTPESSGKVSGITSLSPNMTILTDTDGITIECEYVKDTNKVVGKLVDAINELGGSVTI